MNQLSEKKNQNIPIWYRCQACRISQSYGSVEYEGFKPSCPDCHGPMVKEAELVKEV